jgi:CheY-like chemotaxis protein
MNSFSILCVDDNPSMRETLKIGLTSYGFEVATASDGLDALGQYRAVLGNFRAIVTDNDMPHMNGLEFVRSVRETGYTGRIIVISGNLKTENLQEYRDYAISGFFHKPFDLSLLAAMLLQPT